MICNKILKYFTCAFFTITIIFFFSSQAFPQRKWANYTNVDDITSIVAGVDSDLWISARGGVIHYDISTGLSKLYTHVDGLSNNDVTALAVSSSGHIWQAGAGGCGIAEYYNGEWTLHAGSPYSGPPLGSPSIAINKSGDVFINGGYFSNNVFHSTPITQNAAKIITDNLNNVWFAIYPLGLIKYSVRNGWETFNFKDSVGYMSINDMAIDNSNNIWIASGTSQNLQGVPSGGLYKFDGDRWTYINTLNTPLNSKGINKIIFDKNNVLWVTTYLNCDYDRIGRYDGNNWVVYDSTNNPLLKKGVFINSLGKDNLGSIYFGTTPSIYNNDLSYWSGGGELIKYDGNIWSKILLNNGTVPYSPIYGFTMDNQGKLWMRSTQNGIISFDGKNWINYNSSNSSIFPSNFISAIGIEPYPSDKLWFVQNAWSVSSGCKLSTYFYKGGIVSFDGNKWNDYNLSIEAQFSSLAIDKNNIKWFGTYDKGIFKFDGQSWINYNTSNSSLVSNNILKILIDEKQNIWAIENNQGVSKFDGNTWLNLNSANSGLQDNNVIDFLSDGDTLWFITPFHLSILKEQIWYNYKLPSPYHSARSITKDKSGNIWIGTHGAGVFEFDGKNWINYTTCNSSLSNDYIEGVYADQYGNIWFGAEDFGKGISVYNPEGIITSISQIDYQKLPQNYSLSQNYPNPFNPSTTIKYDIPKESFVKLKIYDILGREVKTLVKEQKSAGTYKVTFEASNLSSGVYFYRIQAGNFVQTKKLILLK